MSGRTEPEQVGGADRGRGRRERQAVAMVLSALLAAAIGLFTALSFRGVSTELGLGLVAFALGVVFPVVALSRLRQIRDESQEPAGDSLSEHERAVLEAAAGNDGWVTPAMVAQRAPDLSLGAARELLDRLQAEGHCVLEFDADGQPFYRFSLGGRPEEERELSPDEWVERLSGRLAGGDESGLTVDG